MINFVNYICDLLNFIYLVIPQIKLGKPNTKSIKNKLFLFCEWTYHRGNIIQIITILFQRIYSLQFFYKFKFIKKTLNTTFIDEFLKSLVIFFVLNVVVLLNLLLILIHNFNISFSLLFIYKYNLIFQPNIRFHQKVKWQ